MSKKHKLKKIIPHEITIAAFRDITPEVLREVLEIIPYEQVLKLYAVFQERICGRLENTFNEYFNRD